MSNVKWEKGGQLSGASAWCKIDSMRSDLAEKLSEIKIFLAEYVVLGVANECPLNSRIDK